MPATHEVNFDGLVGPTHNYAGLSSGNIASTSHRGATSHPRAAALQGLAKMKALADLGLKQAVLPPHERPSVATLRAMGFQGSDASILRAAGHAAPELLVACSSASNMWVANAATLAPSADTTDGRVHFTPANLASKFHRSIEPAQTARTLRSIFRDDSHFVVHEPLPGGQAMGDEGAANHTRLAPAHAKRGLHFFVYGHSALGAREVTRTPRHFASRQAMEASQALARQHLLRRDLAFFAQQNPEAIDAGVFHNDVISVGNENMFLHHEQAFVDTRRVIARLKKHYARIHRGSELIAIEVPARRVPIRDAVRSYLFNSQIVTLRPGKMLLVAPGECATTPNVRAFIGELIARGESPISDVRYFDLKESMRNGGGPACLRLRVVLTEDELAALPPGIILTEQVHRALVEWVTAYYPESLTPADLKSPQLLESSRRALDRLTRILGLGSIYPFQIGST